MGIEISIDKHERNVGEGRDELEKYIFLLFSKKICCTYLALFLLNKASTDLRSIYSSYIYIQDWTVYY